MKDSYGREINYARISLTDLCNYRCIYCMSECGVEKKPHEQMLKLEEFSIIICALSELGVSKIRFTGGEPLVKKGAISLIEETANIPAIKNIALTTNGALLPEFAGRLAKAGVDSVNISIDSLNAARYSQITRGGKLQDALDGLQAAKDVGMRKIKINAVLMRGINDDEILDFAKFGQEENVSVRFIELMPFECQTHFADSHLISLNEVLSNHPEFQELGNEGSTNAVYFKLPDGSELGFISAVSRKFCAYCNRVRITADGKMLNCLHENKEYDLRPYLSNFQKLKEYIIECVAKKPLCHNIGSGERQQRNMTRIGG
ncbi:MAG: GTP 3',8-cyclase MoaA [Clostridia bacterium]|nr:GTP 3',8-cyclase MoaA [Clostridia bacterium]